ncbi:MAG: hypothetical protein P8X84_05670, partial [Candidatus Bathyarchaeota archaeon]
FFYRLWEIPIVVAMLLFGFKIANFVGILNVIAQIILFPIPAGILAYPWGFLAIFTMLIGIKIGKNIVGLKRIKDCKADNKKAILIITFFGILIRVMIMPFIDFAVYNTLLPIALGRTFTMTYIFSLIPAIVAFNIIVPLYTIPVSYVISKRIVNNLKLDEISV